MKANRNLDVLKSIYNNNFGFECVSVEEIKYIRKHFEDCSIIFTPNYCNVLEYKLAFDYDCVVIVDNVEVIENNIEIFKDREIGIRLDLDLGEGHDSKVVTEGSNSKFGMPLNEISNLLNICQKMNLKVVGLHSHRGSDINNVNSWIQTINLMDKLVNEDFDDIKWVNLGGGLGTKLQDSDFKNLESYLQIKKGNYEIWMEPGRYLVSEAGVLLSKVTQKRTKNQKNIVGIGVGMNSLIRPSLCDCSSFAA